MKYEQQGPIVVVAGTRPEGIKMMPVYLELKKAALPVVWCVTLQHDELLTEIFDLFGLVPDYNLQVMRQGQDLFYLTQSILQKTKELFSRIQPSLVLVQGDTTSTMAAALAAFYLRIPILHVEAGLRTATIHSPFPEEMNRRMVSLIADYHCAPTHYAVECLRAEGYAQDRIFYTGNTVVDALHMVQQWLSEGRLHVRPDLAACIEQARLHNQSILLFTMHRRESFDGGLERVMHALKAFLQEHPDVMCCYPFHPNPHVIDTLHQVGFAALANVRLYEPLSYKDMVYVLQHCSGVVTDSGGVQEEAVSLGKRVIVVREATERPEGVWAGRACVVGTDAARIAHALSVFYANKGERDEPHLIYGDGTAARTIAKIVQNISQTTTDEQQQSVVARYLVSACLRMHGEAMKKVCVLGLGYIGLPTALIASEHGCMVTGVDVDVQRVHDITGGNPVIDEPEMFEKLQIALQAGVFTATTTPVQADYFIIAVPTPLHEDTTADLSYVFAAAQALIPVIRAGSVVILESTVPVGTTYALGQFLAEQTKLTLGTELFVAHCPERVLPGNIARELIDNARIIGGIDRTSVDAAASFYKLFVQGPLYLTDACTAEMVKLVENSSRDVQLAFAHQVASMAQRIGLNPYEVIELANKHPRVNILHPTVGVGGHCIAVDPWFLVHTFTEDTALLKAARQVNNARPHEVLEHIHREIAAWRQEHHIVPTVAILGVSYKQDVNDLRESPALIIAQALANDPKIVTRVCDPQVSKTVMLRYFGDKVVPFAQAVAEANIVVYLVAHKRFALADQTMLQGKCVIDCCGIFYKRRPETRQQEQLFWPANSGRVMQSIKQVHLDIRSTVMEYPA